MNCNLLEFGEADIYGPTETTPFPPGAKPFALESKAAAADLHGGLERRRGWAAAQGAQGEQKSSKINPLQIIFISPWDKSHPWQGWFNSSLRQEGNSLRTGENVLFPLSSKSSFWSTFDTRRGAPGVKRGFHESTLLPEYIPRENAPPLPGRENLAPRWVIWSNIIAGRRKKGSLSYFSPDEMPSASRLLGRQRNPCSSLITRSAARRGNHPADGCLRPQRGKTWPPFSWDIYSPWTAGISL